MKKLALLILPVLLLASCSKDMKEKEKTLRSMPKLKEVVEKFYHKYDPKEKENVSLSFAKKTDGWYVLHLKYEGDSAQILDEEKFWSLEEKKFLSISYKKADDEEEASEQTIQLKLLHLNEYHYDHNILFGYKGWEDDVTNLFDGHDEVSDTTIESVAQAWSAKATGIYYKYPQTNIYDEVKGLSESEKAKKYVECSLKIRENYEKIIKRNPTYETFIGSVGTKLATLMMNSWLTLEMKGFSTEAKPFLEATSYSEFMKNAGHNFLACADKNAILFTNGDNDTFPLYYMQEKENFRKDVTIVNVSLIAGDDYRKWILKRDKNLKMLLEEKVLKKIQDESGMVMVTMTSGLTGEYIDTLKPEAYFNSVNELVKTQKKDAWQVSPCVIRADADTSNALFSNMKGNFASSSIYYNAWNNHSYIYLNDLIAMDITLNNFEKRPVCMTNSIGYFAIAQSLGSNIFGQGCVNRIYPEMKHALKSLTGAYIAPVVFEEKLYGMKFSKEKVFSEAEQGIVMNNFLCFLQLADVYLNDSNQVKCVEVLDRMQKEIPPVVAPYPRLLQYAAHDYYLCGSLTKAILLEDILLAQYEKKKPAGEEKEMDIQTLMMIEADAMNYKQQAIFSRAENLLQSIK